MRPRRAFTLLELLVTVGIIAVLVAIVIPAVAGVSRSANTAKCVANLRQIALAHTSYATDHGKKGTDPGTDPFPDPFSVGMSPASGSRGQPLAEVMPQSDR